MSNRESYLGNINLKATAVNVELPLELLDEYNRCHDDIPYFVKTYCKIVTVDSGLINFELWGFQEEMIKKFEDNRFVICKMPRQVGKTTTVAAYLLHKVLFNLNFSVAILANKDTQAREILSRIKMMFEYVPKWMQQGIKRWNEGDILFENDSRIVATATTGSSARGTTHNIIYLDEFAFVPNNLQETFFTSVYPVISSGKSSKTLITSTPKGMNYFYKIWNDSENGKNRYVRCEVHWSMIPGRDEAWREETVANTSERQFRQEFGCEFLGSSNTLIDGAKLAMLTYAEPLVDSGHVRTYANPQENHVYITCVDTSRGVGIDNSAFVVIDVTSFPYTLVARFMNNEISPLVFPNIIYNVSMHFNKAYVLVEINDIGQQVADILHNDLEYDNVIMTKTKGRAGQRIGDGQAGIRMSLGVRTTAQVKRIGCANFKSMVESDRFIINDFDLLSELYSFIEVKDSYKAEEDKHDDIVMCCVLFAWMVNQPFFKELSNNDARLSVFEASQTMVDDDLAPFGFIDDVWRKDPDKLDDLDDPFDRAFEKWLNS